MQSVFVVDFSEKADRAKADLYTVWLQSHLQTDLVDKSDRSCIKLFRGEGAAILIILCTKWINDIFKAKNIVLSKNVADNNKAYPEFSKFVHRVILLALLAWDQDVIQYWMLDRIIPLK